MTDSMSEHLESPKLAADSALQPAHNISDPSVPVDTEIEVSLEEVVRLIGRGRWKIFLFTLLGLGCGLAVALLSKPYFVGEAVFLPPKESQAAQATLIFGGNSSSDVYLGMLSSRTVADEVIRRLDLIATLHARDLTEARNALATMTKTTVQKNEFISVQVRSADPRLAATIANTYLDALYSLNGTMNASASAHRREFFEEQLEEQKNVLSRAEVELALTQRETGVSPSGEVQVGLAATAALQAEVDSAEARLAGLLAGKTEQNAEVVTARSQLNQLRNELARLQSDTPGGRGRGLVANGRLPQLSLEYTQKEREVKLREAMYDSLMQEYQRARLAALDPGPQLQVVDKAVVAEHQSGPSRRTAVLVGLLAGLSLGLGWVLLAGPVAKLWRFLHEALSETNEAASRAGSLR